jgi:hypothetical protein
MGRKMPGSRDNSMSIATFRNDSRRLMATSIRDRSPDFIGSRAHDAFVSRCADQGLIFASFLASPARATRVS